VRMGCKNRMRMSNDPTNRTNDDEQRTTTTGLGIVQTKQPPAPRNNSKQPEDHDFHNSSEKAVLYIPWIQQEDDRQRKKQVRRVCVLVS
jgi:hypothetical protein